MGVIAEKFADEKGLVWPESVAPFKFYLIGIGEQGTKKAEEIYEKNPDLFLFDDRDARVGEKMADSELIGVSFRVVVSDKTLAEDSVELTERKNSEKKLLKIDEFLAKL